MREIRTVQQRDSTHHKRWFCDLDSDLFLWVDAKQNIVAFQFSLRRLNEESAVKWKQNSGLKFYRVDDGTQPGKHPGSPLLIEDSEISREIINAALSDKLSKNHRDIYNFVVERIREST